MATTVISKVGHSALYDTRIAKVYVETYGNAVHQFEKFYRMESTDEEDKRWNSQSGLGLFQQTDSGDNFTFDTVHQGYQVIVTPYQYALGFQLNQIAYEDDRTGILGSQLSAELADSARESAEVLGAYIFNNANSTSYASPWMSGGDGLALLSTAHTIPAGGTYANTPSAGTDLSIDSLQAALTRMRVVPNARGHIRGMRGKRLTVPVQAEGLARELLETPSVP